MKNWFLWLIAGIFSLIAGLIALANPFAATLTVEILSGWMFLLVGVLTLVSAFQDQGWGARILSLLLGLVIALFGFNLLANPLQGMIQLTLMVAILMLIMGSFRIIIAFSPVAAGFRTIMIISGAISVLLALMIFANFPWSAAVILGTFLAIELISNGVSLIFLALDRRKAAPGDASEG